MWVVVILEQGFNPSTLWWTIYSGYSSTSVVQTEGLNGKYDKLIKLICNVNHDLMLQFKLDFDCMR